MPLLYYKDRPRGSRLPPSWWASGSNNTFPGAQNIADELTPLMPLIDVVNDFPWTLTPTNSLARKEAPVIRLREFIQLETYLNQSLLPYGKQLNDGRLPGISLEIPFPGIIPPSEQDEQSFYNSLQGLRDLRDLFQGLDPGSERVYAGLFDHLTSTDFIYELPYFTSDYFDIKNNWESTDVLDVLLDFQTKVSGGVKTLVQAKLGEESKIGKFIQDLPVLLKKIERFNAEAGSPAVGLMDPPHIWKGAQNRVYSFQFPLYNISSTGSSHSIELIQKNWEFCYLLTYQNLVNKRNYYTGIPPVFYEVTIPGVHYCKASYISDLTIINLGNIRLMKLPINNIPECEVLIPDAWSIQITLTDLLQPSKNLLQATIDTTLQGEIRRGK